MDGNNDGSGSANGNGNGQKDLKNKGKAPETSNDSALAESAPEGGKQEPLLPRLMQSASSLPSSLLVGPPSTVFAHGHEKGGESSRAAGALERARSSAVQLRTSDNSGGSIRIGHTQEHVAQAEASFATFLDSADVPILTAPNALETAWQSSTVPPVSRGPTGVREAVQPERTVAEQEALDGAEVVALLTGNGDLDSVFEDVSEPVSQSDLSALRNALFGDDKKDYGTSPIAWDHVLNFIPPYLHPHTGGGAAAELAFTLHLGAANPDEAWEAWVSQWSRVLTNYQDEVWGDLSALVEEARNEILQLQEVKPGERPPEPKALLRLRAILGHLRGA
ncbi:uncharacterized protein CTHT_0010190 [Thermochaetoides thermophila DSM 1495]|uniref:Uncharacterized protein n=1 Tax=Chaetomium thermophilum (strain DSM 1495 / CBS 144.50 / IMI 039719) TaxID=759272 RepID=G0S0J0_CHATD|nr:hypothetical protein CTHT_0010190 [Thermochaetoides thermophila DSM 1495]EGS23351.1 hypothetical protein CTHT_0010190 [Thermochaetoides thermophila DSM 1495]